ncbi:unnamed protein product [Mucor circinelloides]|uniref:Uncharacterized protein n=1 Tax=Mucor circinelloides f. circinelloides (strain 1006PhL) TaxID=1220926 RepID=S2JSA6_MUCC1|nr:hypothetical protein HMPREF1544_10556 [Mucor circinelloides 1006PhL]
MISSQEGDSLINEELFHLYTEYQLCKVRKNTPSTWNADDNEKNALISILTQCQEINGNTLRLVMKDIFDNSVVKYADSNSSVINYTPDMNSSSTGRIPEVIVNTTDDETDSVASREAATSPIYANPNPSDAIGLPCDNAAISKRNILPSSTPRLGRSVTPKLEPKEEKHRSDDRSVHKVLTDNGIEDLAQMTSQVARTEAMLRERCYAINDSVLVNFSSTVSTFSVLNHVGSSDTDGKILYKCQENFIGFRFGKLLERLYQEYPEKVAVARAKGYYRELQRELKRQGKTYYTCCWSTFKHYSNRMVKYVDEFGIYCLFIPNIIAPSKFKRMAFQDIRAVLQHLDERCFAFKDIVKVDREGNIIKPQSSRPKSHRVYERF